MIRGIKVFGLPASVAVLIVLAFIFISQLTFAQDADTAPLPQWLQMERGIKAYDEGKLGSALRIFRAVAEDDPLFANVHMWIGHVFAAEGEYTSAKAKYMDALEEQRNFFPKSERINAYYSLAEVHRRLEEWDEMETYLHKVIDEAHTQTLPEERVRAMENKFLEEGPDKLLELYRLTDKPVRKAYEQLGEISLRQQEYREAVRQLLLSLTTSFSIAIEHLQARDPEYSFIRYDMNPGLDKFFIENTELLLEKSRSVPQLQEYFDSVRLYRQLYLLGMAMLGIDEVEKAEQIWLIVAEYRGSGIWSNLARNQIASPSLEVLPIVLHYR
ncbi:MAG: tetratricopeptide repeat protein [Spirochaetota bacterium]